MVWAALLALALAAAPFVVEHLRKPMTDARRGAAPGQWAQLSQGVTHYRLSGPDQGPLVVCIHGLTTPGFVWDALTEPLAARGFRVLVYDLYGRGYSDRPKGAQDAAFFNRQLDDLLAHLGLAAPAHVIGYSMGGAVAAGYAAANPTRVRRLILLASAGMTLHDTALLRTIRTRGLLGQWLMLALYPAILRRGIRAERATAHPPAEVTEGQEMQLVWRGFVPAVLASLRGILAQPMESAHQDIRRHGLPVLAIWGAQDDVIPASAPGQLTAWNPGAVNEVIEGAGHGLPYTHASQVLDHITAFLPDPTTNDRR